MELGFGGLLAPLALIFLGESMQNFYGGVKPLRVIGREQFARHDATATWDDGGVAIELAVDAVRQAEDQINNFVEGIKQNLQQRFQEDLAAYGAHQVRDGVVDYVSNGYIEIGIVDGKLCVCFDASNDKAKMHAAWDLDMLLRRAANEASNKGDRETYAAIVALHDALPGALVARPEADVDANAQSGMAASSPIGRRPKGVVRSRETRSMV